MVSTKTVLLKHYYCHQGIFGNLVTIVWDLVTMLGSQSLSSISKHVSRNFGPFWQRGLYNDTDPYLLCLGVCLTFERSSVGSNHSLPAFQLDLSEL